ncbi:MAG: hypothetical protein P1U86_12910 [Verrucomicrobiales bacterium]|nr:hypothetical protein [Verrucomicrobiales bacterium]
MKFPNTPLALDSLIGSSEPESDSTLHELILREYILMCAIEKTSYRTSSLSEICDEGLLADLQSNQDFLQNLSDGILVPAIAALTSPAARQWELDLLTILSQSGCRWESVRRLAVELRAVTKLIDALPRELLEATPLLSEHRQKLGAHLKHQEALLSTWVKTEMSHGTKVEKVLAKESTMAAKQWDNVVVEILGTGSCESNPIPIHSWRSFPHVVRLMMQSLQGTGKNKDCAA